MSRAVSLDGGAATTASSVTLSQLALRAKMPYIAVSPSASILRLGARAGNAHKSAAFLEEEWLIGAGWPCWLVNRVNRRPGIGDHVAQLPIVDLDIPQRLQVPARRPGAVAAAPLATAAAEHAGLGRAPRPSDLHNLQLLPQGGDRQPDLPASRLNQPEVPVLFDWVEAPDFRQDRLKQPAEIRVRHVGAEL